MDLGDLGVAPEPLDVDFGWFGARIRAHPYPSDLGIATMLRRTAAEEGAEPDGTAETRAVEEFMRGMIHPDDFERFWQLAQERGLQMQDFAPVSQKILAAASERPTRQPSDSSSGQTSTAPRSAAGLSSEAIQSEYESQGRSDLAQVVQMVRQAQAG